MTVSSSSEETKLDKEEEQEDEEDNDDDDQEIVVKWANHYSSDHHILLVGDGDFSFSLCLANAFGSASNIVATSLDSHDTVVKKYNKAKSNLERLKEKGATILHQIDATKMKFHTDLKMRKFDRIVFNFPHAGFKGKEDNMRLIKNLVNGFFKNASHMLRPYGEVHVSHKIGDPFHRWNLEEIASKNSLILTECADFSIEDYPGYNNKRGDGSRCDQPFPLGECRTFKFRIGNVHKRKRGKEVMPDLTCSRSFTETTVANPSHLESFSGNHLPHAGYYQERWVQTNFLNEYPLHYPPRTGISNVYLREPCGYGLNLNQLFRHIEDPLRNSYQPYINEALRNTEYGYSNYFSRQAQLRESLLAYNRQEESIHFSQSGSLFGGRQLFW